MNKVKFCGIKEIDDQIDNFEVNSNFLIQSELNRQSTLFSLHFAFTGISQNEKCLYLTSHGYKGIKYYSDYIGTNIDTLVKSNKMLLLKYPDDISEYLADTDNFDIILEDLNVYIKIEKPERIVFDKINPLILNSTDKISTILFNKLLYFLENLDAKCMIVFDKLSADRLQLLSNISFSFLSISGGKSIFSEIDSTYVLTNHKYGKDKPTIQTNFKTEFNKGIVYQPPKMQQEMLQFKIERIFYPSHYKDLDKKLNMFSPNAFTTIPYKSIDDVIPKFSMNNNELVLLDESVDGKSGYKTAVEIQKLNNHVNFGLITTGAISPNRRIFAAKVGFTSYLFFPFTNGHIQKFVNSFTERKSLIMSKKIKVYVNSLFKNLNRDDTFMDFKDFGIRLKNYSIKISSKRQNYCLVKLKYDVNMDNLLTNEVLKVVKPDFFAKYYSLDKITIIMIKHDVKAFEKFKDSVKTLVKINRKLNMQPRRIANDSKFEFPEEYFQDGSSFDKKLQMSKTEVDFYYFPLAIMNVNKILDGLIDD